MMEIAFSRELLGSFERSTEMEWWETNGLGRLDAIGSALASLSWTSGGRNKSSGRACSSAL